ncbi:hypothetical protein C8F01DRAFT_18215 [Mycena amicta]|nr:hypothetical protein C8F01DRAFT_18215 [Mycena amicta]
MSAMLFDTHMADYAPIDVEMAPNSWFDALDQMEDDQNHYSDHESTHSVEVDMDGQYPENEYEMADEEVYEEMSADLVDVQVSEPLDTTLPTEQVANETHAFVVDSTDLERSFEPSPLPLADAELPDAVPHSFIHEEEIPEVEEVPTAALQDADLSVPVEESITELVETPHADSRDELEQPDAESIVAPPADDNVDAEEELVAPEVQQLQTTVDSPHEPPSADEESGAVADPHEISDGVYIDPPPAILVAFDSPSCPDICLFNQPTPSRSPSPGHTSDHQVFDVLLRHHPILYYEPLVSVFEALRQDEYLSRIDRLAESELVLDAYDLQLTISEDNIYAREISLHDLNVLHDASNISGPLRLRLNTVLPRFIVRYHALQANFARLNTVDADGEPETRPSDNEPQGQESKLEENEHQAQEADETLQASVPDLPTQDGTENLPTNTIDEIAPNAEGGTEENDLPEEPDDDQRGADADESHGENAEHGQVDDAEDAVPDLPEEEEGEEDQFVVVGQSELQPEVPASLDTGNEVPSTLKISSPFFDHQAEAGPSKLTPTTADAEGGQGLLANDSADASYNDSYAEEEEEEEQWDDAVGGESDPDTTWDADAEQETLSNQSSVTLSSKASKRSIDEVEADEEESRTSPPNSPGSKRTRVV